MSDTELIERQAEIIKEQADIILALRNRLAQFEALEEAVSYDARRT